MRKRQKEESAATSLEAERAPRARRCGAGQGRERPGVRRAERASGRSPRVPGLRAGARARLGQPHLPIGARQLATAPTSQGRREHQLKRGG